MSYFPMFIELAGQDCLVVGAGKVAERKVRILLEYGPNVRVVAPEATERLRQFAAQGRIKLFLRPYSKGDLEGAQLVIAACSDPDVNREISRICRERKIPVNVVDVKEECSFLFPALVKDGNVTVGISTGGESPAMAGLLKERVRQAIPQNCGQAAAWVGLQREALKKRIAHSRLREAVCRELANIAFERGEEGFKGFAPEKVDEIIKRKMEIQDE